MSSPNPVLVAAAPSLIAVLQALQTFVANVGVDPVQMPVKFPGALSVLVGSIELQLPGLAEGELAALQGEVNSKISGLITKLQAAK